MCRAFPQKEAASAPVQFPWTVMLIEKQASHIQYVYMLCVYQSSAASVSRYNVLPEASLTRRLNVETADRLAPLFYRAT